MRERERETEGTRKDCSLARKSRNCELPGWFQDVHLQPLLAYEDFAADEDVITCRHHIMLSPFGPRGFFSSLSTLLLKDTFSWAMLVRSLIRLPHAGPADRAQTSVPTWLILPLMVDKAPTLAPSLRTTDSSPGR